MEIEIITYVLLTHVRRNRTTVPFFFSLEVFAPHAVLVIVTRESVITISLDTFGFLPE
jgi:hypothetical protein